MKVIVKDKGLPKGKCLKKSSAMNEDTYYDDDDELDEFLDESDYVPMAIPILKKRVWVPVKDDYDPQGHRWISIDEWMPLGSLYKFKKSKWLPIGYYDEEDWVPYDDYDDEEYYY